MRERLSVCLCIGTVGVNIRICGDQERRSRIGASGCSASLGGSWAATYLKLTVEIVKRPQDQHTFEVLPRRWVVERTLAWITSYRRCARDYERLAARHQAVVYWAMITLMARRLARPG